MTAKKITTKKPAVKKVIAKHKTITKTKTKPVIKEEEALYTEKPSTETITSKEKYFQAIGRRKESIARVRLYTKKSTDTVEEEKALVVVNGKDYRNYFSDVNLWSVVESPLRKLKSLNRFKATVVVNGGGSRGQADAIKHGISRALVEFDLNFRKKLKKSGFLTRDSRIKERRKYGHKKARKMGQFSKR
jgi:small subunit ribosomal protein S9